MGHSQLDQHACCVSLRGRQEGGNQFIWRNNYPEVAKYKEMGKHKFKNSVNSREEVPRNGPHSGECQKTMNEIYESQRRTWQHKLSIHQSLKTCSKQKEKTRKWKCKVQENKLITWELYSLQKFSFKTRTAGELAQPLEVLGKQNLTNLTNRIRSQSPWTEPIPKNRMKDT